MKVSKARFWKSGAVASLALALAMGAHAVGESGAQPENQLIKTLTQGIAHSAFFGISFDAGKGVAVGINGSIYESADGGVTWSAVAHDTTKLALLAVDRRGPHTIAVGQSGVVLVEESPGKWTKVDTGDTARLFSVSVNSSGLAVAVGEFGKVTKSEDGGRTWTPTAPDWTAFADEDSFGTGEPNMYSAVVSESGEITIAGEYGVILRSNDRGASWTVLRPVTPGVPTIFAMHLSPAGQGNSYAVGQDGTMLTSADGGLTWLECTMATKLNFLGVAASADGHVVVTGMRVMMRSQNGGMTWDMVDEGDTTTDWYQAVRAEPSTGRIVAVGHSGRIIQIGG